MVEGEGGGDREMKCGVWQLWEVEKLLKGVQVEIGRKIAFDNSLYYSQEILNLNF